MADRIISMRTHLYDALVEVGAPGSWEHIKKQIGMFRWGQRAGLPRALGAARCLVALRTGVWDAGRAFRSARFPGCMPTQPPPHSHTTPNPACRALQLHWAHQGKQVESSGCWGVVWERAPQLGLLPSVTRLC